MQVKAQKRKHKNVGVLGYGHLFLYSECHSSLFRGTVDRVAPTRIKHIVYKWGEMHLSDFFLYHVFPIYQVAGDLHLGCQHIEMVILNYTI